MNVELDSSGPGFNWVWSRMARSALVGWRWPIFGVFLLVWWPPIARAFPSELSVAPFLRWDRLADGVGMFFAGFTLALRRRLVEIKIMTLTGRRDDMAHDVMYQRLRGVSDLVTTRQKRNSLPPEAVEPAEPTDTGYVGGGWQ